MALGGDPRPNPYAGVITVSSEPPGARCVVTKAADGAQVAEIATPGQVPLPRSTAIVEARCSGPARMDTTAVIRPVRDFAAGVHHPQPVGTGAVQNAVVVRTGSTRRYNDVTVHLPPVPFASAEARDAWFAERADAMRREAAPAIARARRASNATIDTAEELERYLAEDLARLGQQKAAATIEAPIVEPQRQPVPPRRR
ncbi:hypothetical protein [Neoroseomonas soli]|uniref:Uncharacterized protein n=1 Tax=Neoroseomonas soli TaxID=1081025 RepID=A0A9X9WT14_9PROT|nr:hypothetical protein [Neoroseomonas soli]MBR0670293.1 hypothetical protein [Neoroseomonas soli]